MRIGETNTPNDVLWTEQDVYFSSLKKPNKYLPDQAQLSIAAFIPIEDWQYIGRFLT